MNILGSRLKSWTMLRDLEATAVLLEPKFGDLGPSWSYWPIPWGQVRAFCGHVEAQYGYYVGGVKAICWISFSHVVGPALRPKMLSPSRTKILSGCELCCLRRGVK